MGEVDLRAELFIRKFREDMRLQSQRSAEEFQAMLARGHTGLLFYSLVVLLVIISVHICLVDVHHQEEKNKRCKLYMYIHVHRRLI
jgi:hypothetical protein